MHLWQKELVPFKCTGVTEIIFACLSLDGLSL